MQHLYWIQVSYVRLILLAVDLYIVVPLHPELVDVVEHGGGSALHHPVVDQDVSPDGGLSRPIDSADVDCAEMRIEIGVEKGVILLENFRIGPLVISADVFSDPRPIFDNWVSVVLKGSNASIGKLNLKDDNFSR